MPQLACDICTKLALQVIVKNIYAAPRERTQVSFKFGLMHLLGLASAV